MKERVSYLIFGRLAGILNEKEEEEFQIWLQTSPENQALYADLGEKPIAKSYFDYRKINGDKGFEKFINFIRKRKDRIAFIYLASAVCVAACITAIIFFSQKPYVPNSQLTATVVDDFVVPPDPVIVLSDSSVVHLNNLGAGGITEQLGVRIKLKGPRHLVYEQLNEHSGKQRYTLYNTLSIPYGKPWKVTLPDGTNVWINAGSAISFPITETNSDRVLNLKGEGHFEVAKEDGATKRPAFKVMMRGTEIAATGTKFNIRGYEDDSAMVTTLLKGQVTVLNKLQRAVLSPGLAAVIDKQSQLKVKKAEDTLNVDSWTRNILRFRKSSLHDAMLLIKRAYNVDVKFMGGSESLPLVLEGGADMDMPLKEVLNILEHYVDARFILNSKNEVSVIPRHPK